MSTHKNARKQTLRVITPTDVIVLSNQFRVNGEGESQFCPFRVNPDGGYYGVYDWDGISKAVKIDTGNTKYINGVLCCSGENGSIYKVTPPAETAWIPYSVFEAWYNMQLNDNRIDIYEVDLQKPSIVVGLNVYDQFYAKVVNQPLFGADYNAISEVSRKVIAFEVQTNVNRFALDESLFLPPGKYFFTDPYCYHSSFAGWWIEGEAKPRPLSNLAITIIELN